MADKTIGELDAAKIGSLPVAPDIYDDTLIPVEQQGEARHISGRQWTLYAKAAAAADVQRAVDAADAAEKSAGDAAGDADRAEKEADRAQSIADGMQVDYDALHQAVEDAQTSAGESAKSAQESDDSAELSRSWAVGGTGSREGEDTNNSKYWAGRAQAEAERAAVPPVEGVYNIILVDRITADRYALIVEDGRLSILGVSSSLEATEPVLLDRVTSQGWKLAVESGKLLIEGVA